MTKRINLKSIMKLTSMLTICALFVVIACSEIEPQSDEPAPEATTGSPIGNGADANGEEVELRTEQVLDTEQHKDKLSVRYFLMEDKTRTGDAILVTTPDGKTMMIDAGTQEGGRQAYEYLQQMGIDKIDVIVNTHPHIDHLGGFPIILNNMNVDRAYTINHPYPTSGSYNNFMSALRTNDVELTYVEEGDTFELGEHVKVEIFRPLVGELPDAIEGYSAAQINQFSTVFKLTYEDTSFLFSGDIYTVKESEILENLPNELLEADMMHAPHHGSETSSSSAFVEAVSPKVVVMSSNIFTSFKLFNRYEYYGATPYSTALHGNILIMSDGKDLEVITEKDWVNPLEQ